MSFSPTSSPLKEDGKPEAQEWAEKSDDSFVVDIMSPTKLIPSQTQTQVGKKHLLDTPDKENVQSNVSNDLESSKTPDQVQPSGKASQDERHDSGSKRKKVGRPAPNMALFNRSGMTERQQLALLLQESIKDAADAASAKAAPSISKPTSPNVSEANKRKASGRKFPKAKQEDCVAQYSSDPSADDSNQDSTSSDSDFSSEQSDECQPASKKVAPKRERRPEGREQKSKQPDAETEAIIKHCGPTWKPVEYDGWGIEKKRCWDEIATKPNDFYFKYPPPGVTAKGRSQWSQQEIELFLCNLKLHPPCGQWGLFSLTMRGRTGQQCQHMYEQLTKTGIITFELLEYEQPVDLSSILKSPQGKLMSPRPSLLDSTSAPKQPSSISKRKRLSSHVLDFNDDQDGLFTTPKTTRATDPASRSKIPKAPDHIHRSKSGSTNDVMPVKLLDMDDGEDKRKQSNTEESLAQEQYDSSRRPLRGKKMSAPTAEQLPPYTDNFPISPPKTLPFSSASLSPVQPWVPTVPNPAEDDRLQLEKVKLLATFQLEQHRMVMQKELMLKTIKKQYSLNSASGSGFSFLDGCKSLMMMTRPTGNLEDCFQPAEIAIKEVEQTFNAKMAEIKKRYDLAVQTLDSLNNSSLGRVVGSMGALQVDI
eukprot:CAMPEP_0175127808 /NCGR_PEP_ID=MMETSP0087-20121206/4585_1 /TAXON_ID=136419 /ORGANISM="Unknown Unknown, Strain D1" /LENGTH=647 /DNA_ID=CAMNT_0016409813 /DNA_START=124 /DNA_END=2067 /DNA_ORIENTATION=-